MRLLFGVKSWHWAFENDIIDVDKTNKNVDEDKIYHKESLSSQWQIDYRTVW